MIHKYNNLGWECSPVATSGSSSWSNQQHEIGDSGYGTTGDKMELPVDIFNLIQPLHKSTIEPISHHDVNYSNFEKISQMFQHVAQRVDSINLATNFNFSQYQEAIKRAHDMIMGQGYPLCTGLMADFGTMPAVDHHTPYVNGKSAVSTTTASFESLDCLLSATNSNTNTSVENYDGINSMIFTDGKKLWNFGSISSGDSAGNNKKQISRIHEVDEAVYCSSQLKHNSKKIVSDQSKLFRGDFSDNPPKLKKPRLLENKRISSSSNINFQQPSNSTAFSTCVDEPDSEAIAQMKEMIYRAAAFRPVNLGEEVAVEKPRRKNVRISSDPQTVAARQRREKISEKIRVLQRLVPGGSKMDTASMLDEAANYLKFLRSQVKALETIGGHKLDFVNCQNNPFPPNSVFPLMINHSSSFPMQTTHFNSPFQNPNPVHHPNS